MGNWIRGGKEALVPVYRLYQVGERKEINAKHLNLMKDFGTDL